MCLSNPLEDYEPGITTEEAHAALLKVVLAPKQKVTSPEKKEEVRRNGKANQT